jgi:HAMP domain-containing protein
MAQMSKTPKPKTAPDPRDEEIAALKAEVKRLKSVLKFHLGRDDL